ncbi:hypothetical protein ACS0TY_018353 [Phlomoides rotata]
METLVPLQIFRKRPPSTPVTTPDSAKRSSSLNQVLLHDWWLVRADSDSHGKQIGIGGFIFNEGIGAKRRFASAPIVKRQDAVTLKTVDGITIMVLGYLNKFQTLKNGFSHEVCDHFVIGFPYYWEEFADLSVREERADICGSKEVPCTDAYKTTSPGDHGTDTFDSTLSEASSGKKETLQPIHSKVSVDHNTTNTKKKREDSGNVECVIHSGPKETSQPIHSGPKETSQPIHSMVSGDRNTTHTKKKGKDGSNVERVRHSGPQTRSSARRITRSMQIR